MEGLPPLSDIIFYILQIHGDLYYYYTRHYIFEALLVMHGITSVPWEWSYSLFGQKSDT